MQENVNTTVSEKEILEALGRLEDKNPAIRAGNAIFLGEYRIQMAVERLIGMLDDEDVMAVGAAARSLGQIGDKRAINKLAAALNRLKESSGKIKAAHAAMAMSDESRGMVERELQKLGLWVHYEIMRALAKLGDENTIPAIAALLAYPLDNPDPHYRADSAKALTELINNLPNNETVLAAIKELEEKLALLKAPYVHPNLKSMRDNANLAVRNALKAVKNKEKIISRALNKTVNEPHKRIFDWFCTK